MEDNKKPTFNVLFARGVVEQDYLAKFEVIEHIEEKHRATIQCTLEDMEGKPAIIGTAKLLHQIKF